MEENIFNFKIGTIQVEKLRVRAYIGFNSWEKEKLQDIVISFSFKYNMCNAIKNDNVNYAINYKSITKEIIKITENSHFQLLESIGEAVFDYIKSVHHEIYDLAVTIDKPNALRFCDNVSIFISDKDRYNIVLVSLGSNINPDENIQKALSMLSDRVIVSKQTELITTEPIKFKEQPHFKNCAVLIYTKQNFYELRHSLKEIEIKLGRKKTENKNAPREIDLDIILFNSLVVDNDIEDFPFLKDFINQLQPNFIFNAKK